MMMMMTIRWNDQISEKSTMTPIHVLRSNFREIGRREVPQMARCFAYKKVFDFSQPLGGRWTEGAKIFQASYHLSPRFPVRFRPDWLSFAGVMCGKLHSTRRNRNICFRHIINVTS